MTAGAYDVVAIAASAGGVQALSEVLSGLPAQLPAAVLVVQHLQRHRPSHLAHILAWHTAIPVTEARDDEAFERGRAYIAPPDRHMLVQEDWRLRLTHTQLVHFVRPSADLLFESVAGAFRERAIAVVLSGTGCDGAMGVRAIKESGGIVIVQHALSAEFSGMPESALATHCADFELRLEAIPGKLLSLLRSEPAEVVVR